MTRVMVLSDLWLPFPGGAERLMFNLSRYLYDDAGMGVAVLTGYEAARQPLGPKVTAQPIGDGDGDPGWAPVAEFIGAYGPDVILTHHHYARLFAAELAATGIPLVQVVLNGPRLDAAALAVFITEHVRELAGNARPQDLTIWPPAMPDVRAYDTSGEGLIGFVKPIPHKGVDLVYRLAHAMPERRFLILRGEWQTLERLPKRPMHNVEFMDPVEDIREFWRRLRLVLAPSISEDAGTIAQEATVNMLPCVSSNVGGLLETNGGGVLLDPHDTNAWRRAITALDDPMAYTTVVDRQVAWLEAHDHPGRLADFADLVRGLG